MSRGLSQHRAQAEDLIEQGSLARSECSRSFLAFLGPLLDSGVVVERREGAGRRIEARDRELLRRFVDQRFPGRATIPSAESRISAVEQFRDSKALRNRTPEVIQVRVWSRLFGKSWGKSHAFESWTHEMGVASFVLDETGRFPVGEPVAVVENPAVFLRFEELVEPVPAKVAIYSSGRISSRILSWLKSQRDPKFSVIHLPDYDPVGLADYERLSAHLGERVRLWIPGQIEELFGRFGNRRLLKARKSQAMLARLRGTGDADIARISALIERHNAGLEQEALLIRCGQSGMG